MAFSIRFNEEKNQLLKATRGIGFEEAILAISNNEQLGNIINPNVKRPNQWIYIIQIEEYAYVVPYVIDKDKKEIFLKTTYPSRFFTKKYLDKRRKE